jgi:hypothetical protein
MNDDSKKRILARRAKFMMAALAVSGVACAKVDDDPKPTTDAAADTQPSVCLSADAEPCLGVSADAEPCLEPPLEDTGVDAGDDADADAEPMPCLTPAIDGG